MAWDTVSIDINGVTYLSHVQGNMFSIPFSSGLVDGDVFKVGAKDYKVTSTMDVADRGEVLLVNTMEVKNDKPKARRNGTRARKPDVPSEVDDGHDNAD